VGRGGDQRELADKSFLEVAACWPEFAAEGKDRLTLWELLEHLAGLVGIPDGGFTTAELADDRLVAARPAGQRPLCEAGGG
jgi:hypothetical protein